LRFFNIDLHVSVIKDLQTIFSDLGHQIDSLSLSSHDWVFGNEKSVKPEIITSENWKTIDRQLADKFYEHYKDKLDEYDGFVVTHTPVFARLYERFDKPIIVVCSTRYEFPYTDDLEKWTDLNLYLSSNKNVILVANNKVDQRYTKLLVNKEVILIESLCSYTNAKYNPTNKESIIYSKARTPSIAGLVHKTDIPRISWKELYSYNSIVHMPYNVSTMSIFEQYYANVPLLVPSLEMTKKLLSSKMPLFSEVSYRQVLGIPSKSIFDMQEDLNNYDMIETMMEWIKLSDFYIFPHIIYFESFDDLRNKIRQDYSITSFEMQYYNYERKDKIYMLWNKILGSLK